MIPPGVRLVIFDADNTLRRTTAPGKPCPHSPSEWEPLPGIREALAGLSWGPSGLLLGMASTQDHVAYGHLTAAMALRLLQDAAEAATGHRPPPGAVRFCAHPMDAGCPCRKPEPGLLHEVMAHHRARPAETLFVGDHEVDREAARRAHVAFLDVADLLAGRAEAPRERHPPPRVAPGPLAPEDRPMPDTLRAPAEDPAALAALIADAAEPLPDPDDPTFALPFDRFAEARVVLLGEASHGTSEFYRARAAITRRLIEHHGFTVVGVEADWPDAAVLDRHVRHLPARPGAEPPFQRFPTWMWRNREVAGLLRWLREFNAGAPPERRAGFHGLDMYNMNASIAAVLAFLDEADPEAAALARERYGCLSPSGHRPTERSRGVLARALGACEGAVTAQARDLLARQFEDGHDLFDAAQDARLVASAERYYRISHHGGPESWNLRDTHMFETLEALLAARGEGARAVVWAHNSHVGDARATAMGWAGGELNLGQLCRERWGTGCVTIGFGTHAGTVAAASDWGGALEVKEVRPSREGSLERLCHDAGERSGLPRFLLDLRPERPMRDALLPPRLERFIGVIYRPESELRSHYAEAALPRQFDAWLWLDRTTAVTPLDRDPGPADEGSETWPFGL